MKLLNELYPNIKETMISGVQMDNRKVEPGNVFVCIEGFTVDGHQFASDAVSKGAVAVICQKELNVDVPTILVEDTTVELARISHWFYNDPSSHMKMIGVTGTNGKTTTTNIIKHIIGEHVGYIGTNGYSYNHQNYETKNTTPDALTLAQIFDEMYQNDVMYVSMEVSSRALDLKRTASIEFDVALFTNITHEHLDEHLTMENYLHSKGQLFESLGEDQIAILNIDDTYSFDYLKSITKAKTLTYGLHQVCDYQASDLEVLASGTSFTVTINNLNYSVVIPLLGEFNVYNALGALVVCHSLGFELDYIIERLKSIPVIDGRMEVIDEGQNFTVIVDYAHTPDGLEKVLEYAKQISKNKVRVVVGCAGSRDRIKRPIMAKISCDLADQSIFTTDDPHAEDPVEIIKEMENGVKGREYDIIIDRKSAIKKAIEEADTGDVVIIAGRGHQLYQYWKSGNIVLDDRKEARDSLLQKIKK